MNLEFPLTLVVTGSEGSLKSKLAFSSRACVWGWQPGGRSTVSLRVRLAGVPAVQMGMQPRAPPPAQLLCVLNSVRSDYLEVAHLLCARLSLLFCILSLAV